jgi:hypothetical protein
LSSLRRASTLFTAGALAVAQLILTPASPAQAVPGVDTWSELVAAEALQPGSTVRLAANIEMSSGGRLEIPQGDPVTIDLNGFDLDISSVPDGHAGIAVPAGAQLVVTDSSGAAPGALTVVGGVGGPGIGSDRGNAAGAITIAGGVVDAAGGKGAAGIGTGDGEVVNNAGSGSGSITITGGDVTAHGGGSGAGIGGGNHNSAGEITISDGTIDATGGHGGAGIGGGVHGSGGLITIDGGDVTASGTLSGAGIGSGESGAGGRTTISDGTVTATGGSYDRDYVQGQVAGAGIGSGARSGDVGTPGTVTITGGDVTAVGGHTAAGIGGGSRNPAGEVTIGGGSVSAVGGIDGAGIGGGLRGSGGVISITGGTVEARGAANGAGLGGGQSGDGGIIDISGGTVSAAVGIENGEFAVITGAGIGAGQGANSAGTITISGGDVTSVTRRSRGAAIGGGGDVSQRPVGGTVTISGGRVTATGSVGGASIGGGLDGPGLPVVIGAAAELTVSGVIAFGRGRDATGDSGSWSNSGTVTIDAASTWTLPAGTSATNTGTIINAGSIQGAGTITNTGLITGAGSVANDGTGAPGVTVTPNNYLLSFDTNSASGTTPPPLRVYAASLDEADAVLPLQDPPAGYPSLGWHTAATGGVEVTVTTKLATVLGGFGPRSSTLYSHFSYPQVITFAAGIPSTARVGTSHVLAATGGASGEPVVFSVAAGSDQGACSVAGARVTFRRAGSCVVAADQGATAPYAPAPQATRTIAVEQAPSSVDVELTPAESIYGQQVTATAQTSTSGAVEFLVDGVPVGAPVRVEGGAATSGPLLGVDGEPLAPGAHRVTADLVSADPAVADSSGSAALTVTRAATDTALSVTGVGLGATVAPVVPGAGIPTGPVVFTVAGEPVGTADLDEQGVASLDHVLASDEVHHVAAVYDGDANFTGSSASTSRANPLMTATVTGRKGDRGWRTGPVTVTFTCAAPTAPLVGACPDPVTLGRNGAGRSVTRTVLAADGGVTTVVADGIDIDQRAPAVTLRGARHGGVYDRRPTVRCDARDAHSGLTGRGCRVTRKVTGTQRVTRIRFVASATDRAGHTTRATMTIRVRRSRSASWSCAGAS